MLDTLGTYPLIIIFSLTIIISYFFNIYAKKSGIPAVLLLIGLGIAINYTLRFLGFPNKPDLLPILEVLGVVGLILIVLEAALDLHLKKEKIGVILKAFFVALLGLGGTACLAAFALTSMMGIEMETALLYTIPLSILSSAIILPSIDDLDGDKREFMVYESTFSDIIGVIGFFSVLHVINGGDEGGFVGVGSKIILIVIFSVIISYVLIYVFQNIKAHVKLFLLIAILLLLYAIGEMVAEGMSLIIIMIFGVILNNYKIFFRGDLKKLLDEERVEEILDDFKIITAESAFVIRTFFFIIFGWSVYLGTLIYTNSELSFDVVGKGLIVLVVIYAIRALILFIFNGKDILLQLFLAPRGLITILLFFAIPKELSVGVEFQGVLLFVILGSCLIMAWSLITHKNKLLKIKEEEEIELLENEEGETEVMLEEKNTENH